MSLKFKHSFKYAKTLILWVFFACIIGVAGGFLGSLFHYSIDFVTELRNKYPLIIYTLPIAAIIIAYLYGLNKNQGKIDTNRVIDSILNKKDVPFIMLPLIFLGSVITHLFGGSAGREGAALQLGGSLGYNTGKTFRVSEDQLYILTLTGMSSVFSALFGTPLAASIFVIELVYSKNVSLKAIVPCLMSSIIGFLISLLLGISPVRFSVSFMNTMQYEILFKSFFIAIICGFVSILFCFSIRKTETLAKKAFKSSYIRGLIGGLIVVILTYFVGSYDYNGAGMDVVKFAISGNAKYEAFILKILFTAISVAAGFKGGEIVPAFFVGSTLGCVLSGFIGIDPCLGATVGFISLFCGITKCPIATVILAIEVFGIRGLLLFVLAVIVSYFSSGKESVYEYKKRHNLITLIKKEDSV